MTIELNQLILENFKGIRDLTIDFDKVTNIYGDNGTGKTTIFDAFTWLLFGKNSRDEKDFGIKTLQDGKVVEKIDHSVTGTLTIDGTAVTLKRTYSEKWTRRRVAEEAEMTGHETAYLWDNVPVQAGDYSKRVSDLIGESLFKMITSATYFNAIDWKKRREILVSMAGEVSKQEIIAAIDKPRQATAKAVLDAGKSIDEQRKALAGKKKLLADELKNIPPRVDEVKRSLPEAEDESALKAKIGELSSAIIEIDNAISDQVKAHQQANAERTAKLNEAYELRKQASKVQADSEMGAREKYNDEMAAYQTVMLSNQRNASQIESLKQNITSYKADMFAYEQKIVTLRDEWTNRNGETLVINDNEFVCSYCTQDLPPDTIVEKREVMSANFEKNKAAKLAAIRSEADQVKRFIEDLKSKIAGFELQIERLSAEIVELPKEKPVAPETVQSPKAAELIAQADAIELSVMEAPVIDVEGMKQRKGETAVEIDGLKKRLEAQKRIAEGNVRVSELLAQEKDLAQQLADLEKYEFAMAAIEKAQMDMVEQRVNNLFGFVQWKMFDRNINGGLEPTCEALVKGVPYSDLNSAGKIQAGIDCINTLSKYYNVFAPVWIDNRESVNEIPECKSQIIGLIVSKDQSLTIK